MADAPAGPAEEAPAVPPEEAPPAPEESPAAAEGGGEAPAQADGAGGEGAPAEAAPAPAEAGAPEAEAEAPEEAAGGNAADAACVAWIRARVELLAPSPAEGDEEPVAPAAWVSSLWDDGEHLAAVSEFLQSVTCRAIFAFVVDGALTLTATPPTDLPDGTAAMYFARDPAKFVTANNIDTVIAVGKFFGSPQDSLLRLMSSVYVPSVVTNKTWPDSVKKEFSGQLHKFMAQLTESANLSLRGKTVLYVPAEPLGEPREVAKEKDLVQRLESTLIHWTRQIKEVVGTQDNSEQLEEDPGPLDRKSVV